MYVYVMTPFVAWLIAGGLKFFINCVKHKRCSKTFIGYGGMPSNHSTIVASMASLIGFDQGFNTPMFGVAITLAFIVALDAGGLRGHVTRHARALNEHTNVSPKLRATVGHTRSQILAGLGLGAAIGYFMAIMQTCCA